MAKTFPTYSEWRKQNGNRGTQEQYQSAKAQYDRYQVQKQVQKKENRANFFKALRYSDMPYATAMKQESIDNLDKALSDGDITLSQWEDAMKREFADSMISSSATAVGLMAPAIYNSRMAAATTATTNANRAVANNTKAMQTIQNNPNISPAQKAAQQKFVTADNIPFANQQRAAAASAKNSAYNMMGVGYPTAATALAVGKSYIGSQSPIVPQGSGPVNPNYQTPTNNSRQPGDLNGGTLPAVVIKPQQPRETVSQKWTRITGTPWSEAKKRGFTTGSYEDNVRINKMLDKGYFNQENAVYWDNKQDNAARMHEVMIPAYESGMSPYDYSVQLADQRNNANLPTSWDPEEDYNTVNDYAIGDASMRGNYDEEINNEPTYQINTSPSYNYNNVDNGNETTYYPYQGIPTQLLYSPQERGEDQYAHSVYGYPGTAYGDGSDYPQQFSPAFDAWSGYGNRRYTSAD